MSAQVAWGKFAVVSTALIAGGWALMKVTTPTSEQFYDSLAPDHKKQVDARRARTGGAATAEDTRKRELMATLDPEKPAWAESSNAGRP